MPVNTAHPEYVKFIKQVCKCRDVVDGEEAVKAAGAEYLPKLIDQQQIEYDSYKQRAMFYGAANRTVLGLTGLVFRKPPEVKFPNEELLETLGASGESFEVISKELFTEVVSVGRVGGLVDLAEDGQGAPYITIYYAENIVNWKDEKINGRKQPTLVVLRECVEEADPTDPFTIVPREVYRSLHLESVESVDGAISRTYIVRIWKKVMTKDETGKDREEWVIDREFTPKIAGGKTLDFIPFAFINPTTTTSDFEKSPILDLVNVNLSHYRTSADLEHGRHYTALPTAWVAGFNVKGSKLYLGSQTAWVTENEQAKAGFLEFSGAGLESLSNALSEKEKIMAVLGARLLEQQKADSESAETVRLRHAGEGSVLSNIAKSVSEGCEQLLEWMLVFMNQPNSEVSCALNQDYQTTQIDPAMLTALTTAWQSGGMSWDSFFYNLQKGELIPDGVSAEEEKTKIQNSPPSPPMGQIVSEGNGGTATGE